MNTVIPFSRDDIERSVPDRFRTVVNACPERFAVKIGSQSFTYAELDRFSDYIAGEIIAICGTKSSPIVMLLGYGISAIAVILGILKSGNFYVSLDTSCPYSKLRDFIEDIRPSLTITDYDNLSASMKSIRNKCQILNIDDIKPGFSEKKIGIDISSDALAALFYTSGTTGRPKGVKRNHASILYGAWSNADNYSVAVEDRRSLLSSWDFAVSATDIFTALLNGATLCPYNTKAFGASRLSDWLAEEDITLFNPPVVIFRQFLDMLSGDERFPSLRMIFLAGQTLYKQDVEKFGKYFPEDCILVNRMGLTEFGRPTQFIIDRQTEITGDTVPVGYAVEGTEILLIDGDGKKADLNHIGEIAIRSRYLSPGYWRDPELTAQKFLQDPEGGDRRIYLTGDLGRMRPDGCLEHLGRKDFQVKIRGFRVEMSAVEAALHAIDTVKEAAVTAHDHPSGDKYLAAYIVPAEHPPPTVTALRRALAEKLPDYMIPSAFVIMEKLPLTATGKTDRRALPVPDRIRPELDTPFTAPGTPAEKMLADIWAEILELDRIGIHDNFFELGGNSVQAARIVSRIRDAFQTELPLREFFEKPAVSDIAAFILREQARSIPEDELARMIAEVEMLSEEDVKYLLADRSGQ